MDYVKNTLYFKYKKVFERFETREIQYGVDARGFGGDMNSNEINKIPADELVPKDAVKNLGWHRVFFGKVAENLGDLNCIVESDDGVRYACNQYPEGFEIRYAVPKTATLGDICF